MTEHDTGMGSSKATEPETTAHEQWDRRVQPVLGKTLIVGVSLAAAAVVVGALTYLVKHGGDLADYGVFNGEPPQFRHILVRGGTFEDSPGRALIQLGLVTLIMLQFVRVAIVDVYFALARDWWYVGLSTLVLGALILGLWGV